MKISTKMKKKNNGIGKLDWGCIGYASLMVAQGWI
jgi:hypothetical protein